MKTPIALALALLLAATNAATVWMVATVMSGRQNAENDLRTEVIAHASTRSEIGSLKTEIDLQKKIVDNIAIKSVEDLREQEKKYNDLLSLMGEMSKPIVRGERYEDGSRIDGVSNVQIRIFTTDGSDRYIATSGLSPYWKARAGVTVIEAVNRH